MPDEPTPLSRGQRVRYVLYAAAVTVAFFLILDGVIVWLERRGAIETGQEGDRTWSATGDPWMDAGDGWYKPAKGGAQLLPEARFRKEKGDRFRVFIVGGSFVMGVPYTDVGSIPYWLRTELAARYPGRPIEVVNAAQSAQNSSVVAHIAEYALGYEPDLIVVATCNNEGTLPPSKATQRLQKLGTFRLLKRWLKSPPSEAQRPLHTPQDPDTDKVREHFRENLRSILEAAAEKRVPVLLCTLPLNLRYGGDEPGLPHEGQKWEEVVPPPTRCVERGLVLLKGGQHARAREALARCSHVEALRWLGIAQYALGEHKVAETTLARYTELVPRNRCRPSFNAVIREELQRAPGVAHLVDLETLARDRSPHGVPGPELFTDYCHMRWEAQGMVADAILDAMQRHGLAPAAQPSPARSPSRRAIIREHLGADAL